MKDVLSAQKDRFSTRKFMDKELTQFEVETLELACLNAPTAMNRQELNFAFLRDQSLIQEINDSVVEILKRDPQGFASFDERMQARQVDNVFYDAPLVIVISGEKSHYSAINAGIAAQNIALAAEALDLGSCIIGMIRVAFNPDDEINLCSRLGFAAEEMFHVAVAVGYKSIEAEPHSYSHEQIRHFD